ncbi:MAG: hypothetical protein CVV53_01920 [Spirochaetae bacterium HGW-Spirochaetae-9]|nr:MAG: hypothetical protein CVV53_01920 [Spirochaetae bacterium HGW-Spirochaetae-9]
MDRQEKHQSAHLLRMGLKQLASHRPDQALETLRLAVNSIPPACPEELSKALYWLSVALLRLDRRDLAIKSLASAQKLRRRGYARSAYLRRINDYGMIRQPTAALDDFYAFMNLQLASYLSRKSRKRFDSFQERDAVFKILLDAWKSISEGPLLDDRESCEKLILFRKIKPSFPRFDFGSSPGIASSMIRTSIGRTKGKVFGAHQQGNDQAQGRCGCGSGLAFTQCCGRVLSLGEL